jgi:1,4-dihydroxy-2-naphthoyl-CoA hydrolase
MPVNPVPDPADLLAMMPFAATLDMTVESAAADSVTARLPWAPELCTSGGLLHGGALMSLADTTGAICAFLNLPDGAGTATVESKTNFFRGVRGGSVRAVARPLHVGRSFIVVQTDLEDDRGARVGQATQTQAVLAPRASG